MTGKAVAALALAMALVCVASQAVAQQAKPYRVGILGPGIVGAPLLQAVKRALEDVARIDGRPIAIEVRVAEGRAERLPKLTAEFVRLKVDVIVAITNLAAFPARSVARDTPIVVVGAHDAVGTGLVETLSRPGGNVTGVESLAAELDAKRLDLLKEIAPKSRVVAVLYNPADPGARQHLKWTHEAATRLGVGVRQYPVGDPAELAGAFDAMERDRADALLVYTDGVLMMAQRQRVTDLAREKGLPAAYEYRQFVEAGGLLAYGPTVQHLGRLAVDHVKKLLRGARAADVPIAQPTQFSLMINLRAAKALGLKVPPSLLLRADDVIE